MHNNDFYTTQKEQYSQQSQKLSINKYILNPIIINKTLNQQKQPNASTVQYLRGHKKSNPSRGDYNQLN